MRILVVAPMPPRAEGGGAIPLLLHAELEGLRRRHEVTLATAVGDEPGEAEAIEALADRLEVQVVDRRRPPPGLARLRRQLRLAAAWAGGRRPWRTVWFADPGLQRLLDRLAVPGRFDLIEVEDSSMSGFRYPAGVPTVYTHHEVLRPRPVEWNPGRPADWPGWAFGELDWRRWRGFQIGAWRRFDRVQVFCARDAATIASMAPDVSPRVRVNPFGLVLPSAADPRAEEAGTMLFVGNFAHPPNRDAALWLAGEILPAVRARAPDARLRLVGTAPPREVRALAGEAVEVIADAPSVEPLLERAAVVMAPVRTGGGMRMKVLQALGAGKAVVTTARGSEGFCELGEEPPLVLGESAAELADAAPALREDGERRAELGRRGRAFAERHHSPEAWAARLTAVYEEAVSERRGAAHA
jgi:glycosyltransferase involved in cell wall biosynthesis